MRDPDREIKHQEQYETDPREEFWPHPDPRGRCAVCFMPIETGLKCDDPSCDLVLCDECYGKYPYCLLHDKRYEPPAEVRWVELEYNLESDDYDGALTDANLF